MCFPENGAKIHFFFQKCQPKYQKIAKTKRYVALKEDTICCRCGANIDDGALNYSGLVLTNSKIKSGG